MDMSNRELIANLKHRIVHNEECAAHHEKRHGEYVAKHPRVISSIDSEMADWHKGKIAAYKQVIEMLEAA